MFLHESELKGLEDIFPTINFFSEESEELFFRHESIREVAGLISRLRDVSAQTTLRDNFTCCHTEIEAADQTFYLTQSQYTDTGQTSPSPDPIMPGALQGCHWSANF